MDGEEKMIEIVPAYDRLDDVRTLFSEYIDMLVSIDPEFSIYLKIQHYSEEKDDPSMKYAMPDGRLYIALADGEAVGCIALRKLDEERGELKRLYVRPAYRNLGIAAALVERIISDARKIGYSWLYLDSVPELGAAVRLYSKLGFEMTAPYNDSPVERTIFMRKDLRSPSTSHPSTPSA